MPALTPTTVLKREAQAFDVFVGMLEHPDKTKAEVCEMYGMDPKTFDEWMRRDTSALDALRAYIQESQISVLTEIELAWPRGIHEMVVDFVDGHTKTKDRLSLAKFFRELKAELEHQYHAEPGIEDEAHAFLKEGPSLQKVASRMASVEVEPTDSGGVKVHVSSYQDVIEGSVRDAQ